MQLLAENVYASTFSFRSSEGKTVADFFPSLFSQEEETEQIITAEEHKELQDIIAAENARLALEQEKQ